MFRYRDQLPPTTSPCNAVCVDCGRRVRAVLRKTGEIAARVLRADKAFYEVTLYDVLPPAGHGRVRHRHQRRASFLAGVQTPAAVVR